MARTALGLEVASVVGFGNRSVPSMPLWPGRKDANVKNSRGCKLRLMAYHEYPAHIQALCRMASGHLDVRARPGGQLPSEG